MEVVACEMIFEVQLCTRLVLQLLCARNARFWFHKIFFFFFCSFVFSINLWRVIFRNGNSWAFSWKSQFHFKKSFYYNVHCLQGPRATQDRGLQNMRDSLCNYVGKMTLDLNRLRLSGSRKHLLGSQFYKVAVCGKNLFVWNLHLTNGIWKEWGWLATMGVVWWIVAVKMRIGRAMQFVRTFSMENEVARGLQCLVCGKGIVGYKIIHYPQGWTNNFDIYKD